jgi:putative addiction module component (TIGR02574 family)
MGEQARRLLEEVLRLPIQDRAGLATEIIASLDGQADADAEAAWAVEVEARARRAQANPEGGTDWEVVRARVEDKLRRG